MSLTNTTPEVLAALVTVLERGIVVEPYGENWTSRMGAVRIRLADESDPSTEAEGTGPAVTGW